MSDGINIISLEQVKKTYGKGTDALLGIDLKIKKGEFVFIVGTSGSGKSTLIRLLLREIKPTSGTLLVNGHDLSVLKRRQVSVHRQGIGTVFQNFRLLNDRDVYENVAFAQRIIGTPKHEIKKQTTTMLQIVGLGDKMHSRPDQLSGGEQQRVAIARALVNHPPILLADEPTGNLDPKNSWEIMKLLEEVNKNGTTVLVVTHNREIVDEMKKRVVTLHNGKIISDERKGGYRYEED